MGENPRDRRDGRRGRKTSLRVGGKGEFLVWTPSHTCPWRRDGMTVGQDDGASLALRHIVDDEEEGADGEHHTVH
jgi:hypothetical protein